MTEQGIEKCKAKKKGCRGQTENQQQGFFKKNRPWANCSKKTENKRSIRKLQNISIQDFLIIYAILNTPTFNIHFCPE